MSGEAPPAVSDAEPSELERAVPCRDHAFNEALVCSCGVSWWAHQRRPEPCRLNARGRNRGEDADPGRAGPSDVDSR